MQSTLCHAMSHNVIASIFISTVYTEGLHFKLPLSDAPHTGMAVYRAPLCLHTHKKKVGGGEERKALILGLNSHDFNPEIGTMKQCSGKTEWV